LINKFLNKKDEVKEEVKEVKKSEEIILLTEIRDELKKNK
jgi:large-conductance mechanosensitive channel